ncbi:hypothetical protein Pyn_11250 [Prunus yedoensis var. nudiflora]|uniref:Uncharacterized protein n=1 Tax=Prunus yedoensis var. nudiflora TaxID=2094558 RepID=A0A314YBM3_PRUYE|nr:hypothetical protein Pyn_11250 [Prunus yedoensis var. nudiflora]
MAMDENTTSLLHFARVATIHVNSNSPCLLLPFVMANGWKCSKSTSTPKGKVAFAGQQPRRFLLVDLPGLVDPTPCLGWTLRVGGAYLSPAVRPTAYLSPTIGPTA